MLDPPATGRGVIGGQRLSGLNEALALFVLCRGITHKAFSVK
ncbi:hypothetical protein SAMD00020551_1778 [Mesobacillus selenatarsenatis SF-1]|uniref:Uncharacterized protein n=1 Tax=Mesobacillus selenatarsenatis (strain DSM 18680 / JCM 14380 / FERM P-15431 / SF-1) TaxID=1321606 RepID=A0A0A8X116_MESS1|nr:hypothetical protein SAMD00020551_1778 [Mesobacillus selenatarsenatis SF-1]